MFMIPLPGVPDISVQVFFLCFPVLHVYGALQHMCSHNFLGHTGDDSSSAEGVIKDYFGRQSMGGWSRLWNDNCDINTCWNTHAT